MKLTLTAKLQIKPTPEQKELLLKTMRTYASACNYISDYIYQSHELDRSNLQKTVYYPVRSLFGLKAQMTQSCIRTVVASYKTILTNQHEWIKPSFRHPQLNLVWHRDYSVNLSSDTVSVNTLKDRIKVPLCRKGREKFMNGNGKFGSAKLVCKHGKFYLYIPVTYEIEGCEDSDIELVVGVDRGINFIVATYDSGHKTRFISGRQVKQKRGDYKRLRQELQQRQTPSSRRRLKAIGQRENRWMQDVNHCVAKALVTENPKHTLFVLEDLTGIRSVLERVRTEDRYVSVSWAFYDLEQKLFYKAAQNQCKVIKVDPAYTSQKCPVCGHTERGNRNKKQHFFHCKACGYQSNDDRVGGMNLCDEGIKYLKECTAAVE